MRPYIILIIMASFILAGCATTQTSKQVNVLSLPETQFAREYKANGQYEEAIEAFRQLIAAHPKHFNSVLYQHEIMEITESLSDPWRLMDEMNRTLALFETAKAEPFEGATPEAIQHEQDALDEYIIQKSAMYHNIYQTTRNRVYASFAVDLCELQMQYFSDSQRNCNMMYSCADLAYSIKRFDIAVNVYHKILESCEDEKLDNFPKSYVDAALGAVLAYDQLLFSDLCPDSPKKDDDDISEYPIAECRLNYIDALKRYSDVLHKYPPEEKLHELSVNVQFHELSVNVQYRTALIYFEHNQFDKANPLFRDVIHQAPLSEIAVYACNYIFESYRLRKQYKEMLDYILEIKNNQEFMSNQTQHFPELKDLIHEYEAALKEKLETEGKL